MTAGHRPINQTQLLICVLLGRFDQRALQAVADWAESDIEALLTSDLVAPVASSVNTYQLQATVEAGLRADGALATIDGLTLQRRAFDHWLARLAELTAASDWLTAELAEEQCFFHLAQLFLAHGQRAEWSAIAEQAARASRLAPRRHQHRQRLLLYEGTVANRTQRFAAGEALLSDLLSQPDLEIEVRLKGLQELATGYFDQARYDRALVHFGELLALAQLSGALVYEGLALVNLCAIYNELEDHERALTLGRQSLAIFQTIGEPVREARAHHAVGINATYLGRWELAQTHFTAAITIFERLGITPWLADLYWGQGYLHHLLGEPRRATAAFQRGLALARQSDGGEARIERDLLAALGFLHETEGRWAAALDAYDQALAVATTSQHQHRTSQLHYRRGRVWQSQGRFVEAVDAYRQGIAALEGLRVLTEREEVKISLLGTHQQLFEAMVLTCLELGAVAAAFTAMEQASSRAFLDALSGRSPALSAAVDQPVVSLAEVQARLEPEAALIAYFTTGVVPQGEHLLTRLPPASEQLRRDLTLPPTIVIIGVTREQVVVHRSALNPNTLRAVHGDRSPSIRLLHEPLLAHLYNQLVRPVETLLRGRRLLYLVPHGPLHHVPFMALRRPTGEHLLTADGPAIALAPSATILVRNCLARPASQAAGRLAIGFNDGAGAGLRHAEAEARWVAAVMGGQAWLGPAPKSADLLALGPRLRWLHIAGHARFDPRSPLESGLTLGAGDELSARAIIEGLELGADLVTLSACTSGLSQVMPGDELLGLQRAFLYAGTPTVICSLWEAADLVALLVMERFYEALVAGRAPGAALRDAQIAVRALTVGQIRARLAAGTPVPDGAPSPVAELAAEELDWLLTAAADEQPFSDPFYWAPFMLVGRPGRPAAAAATAPLASSGS